MMQGLISHNILDFYSQPRGKPPEGFNGESDLGCSVKPRLELRFNVKKPPRESAAN